MVGRYFSYSSYLKRNEERGKGITDIERRKRPIIIDNCNFICTCM